MTEFVEDRDFLSSSQKQFIDEVVLGDSFPFYWNNTATHQDDGCGFLIHTVLNRPEVRKAGDSGVNSDYHAAFMQIFDSFCRHNGIHCQEVLRIAVNLTMHNGIEASPVHTDHNFPHSQCLIYLNNSPTSLTTILEEDGLTVWREVRAEKFKAVCFPNRRHFVNLPSEGRRVVAVYTFIEKPAPG